MHTRLWVPLITLAAMGLASPSKLYAIQGAVTVQESPGGTLTQYSVLNNSQTTAHPFDITLLVVSTTSTTPNPFTSNLNWIAESLSASTWTQAMGGGASTLLTWQQYTGMTYVQAYPGQPVRLNGYFLNYTFDSGSGDVAFPSNPIHPGGSAFGGFFFTWPLDSTFLVGPAVRQRRRPRP
jgi:hypothetical protein